MKFKYRLKDYMPDPKLDAMMARFIRVMRNKANRELIERLDKRGEWLEDKMDEAVDSGDPRGALLFAAAGMECIELANDLEDAFDERAS